MAFRIAASSPGRWKARWPPATHLAMSSIRVQPIVANIGTAAGLAAKHQAGVREIWVPELRRQLFVMGTLFKTA